ncbi:hypothetical protein A7318_28275 (plasmid) [Pseudomonas lurida]|uniref:hypothetical protein n=1 Tax=Pseudomonas lurida TaxID=244566 RepID=UPI00083CC626|nr:hypothetical protein [Pseudomonas lurida]AOE82535.1 hypothetical protein A7318_28275 [Pseudomonas lurida]
MQIRNLVFSLLLLGPCLAWAEGASLSESPPDTFGKLLLKQAQLLDSQMDMQIRQNQNLGGSAGGGGVNPLPGIKQEINDQEPIVEAIWGLEGKEVAEISYKGRRLPVSMQEPFISKVDGWKLEGIHQYQISMIQTDAKGHVVRRKTIMLDFLGGGGEGARSPSSGTTSVMDSSGVPITPAITSPLMR